MESSNYHFSCIVIAAPVANSQKIWDLLERENEFYFGNWWDVSLEQNWCGGLRVPDYKYKILNKFCCITFSWHDNLGQETLSDQLKFTATVAQRPPRRWLRKCRKPSYSLHRDENSWGQEIICSIHSLWQHCCSRLAGTDGIWVVHDDTIICKQKANSDPIVRVRIDAF